MGGGRGGDREGGEGGKGAETAFSEEQIKRGDDAKSACLGGKGDTGSGWSLSLKRTGCPDNGTGHHNHNYNNNSNKNSRVRGLVPLVGH